VPDPVLTGRSVVVHPNQQPPAAWRGLDRVRIEKVDATTADLLGAAWRSRTPLVIELQPGLGLDLPEEPPAESVTGLQPWEWSVDLDLVGERLHHALWSNSVDARVGSPQYRWATHAIRLGAAIDPSDEADVILPDGRNAICDGGPLDASLAERAGSAVVHRLGIEHASLEPLDNPRPSGLELAPDQLAAVAEPLAGARVIAPAGSGKTRVLTERARLLRAGWRLPPAAMVLVAYNVRAAEEMKARLSDLPSLRIRTLNALALRLCGGRVTIEDTDARRVLSDLVPFPRRAETDPAAPWLEALSRVRLGLAHPDDVEEEIGDVSGLEEVARRYRFALAEKGLADFDEQVTVAVERLLADPAWRRRSQLFARVLLVDELQDLTPAHMLLIRLLSGPTGTVFGVGDDDQTIYGYAGATPRWLIDFARWFPGSADHPLEVNYRCPAPVVDAAATLLRHNSVRVSKEIRAAKAAAGAALTVLDGDDRPASTTVRKVATLLAGGARTADVAVLARVNASLVPVHVLLRHAGIAVNRPADSHFLQRGGVRAALAWLSVATAPASAIPGPSLREAARRPKRAMSQSLLDLVAKQRSLDGLTSLATWLESKGSSQEARKVGELAADVRAVRRAAGRDGATTASVLRLVRSQVAAGGLDASADALDQWTHGAISAHADDLAALSELAELAPDPASFGDWLREHLAAPSDESGVTLASIHAVKGREWPHVVVHHATDGLLPHRLADDVEEERRVFHVALTRCVDTVTVVTGSPSSPFVAEMSGVAPAAPVVPARAGSDRTGSAGGSGGRRAPSGEDPSSSARSATRRAGRPPHLETVPAAVGLRFERLGREYDVTSIGDYGATATVRGGRASIVVPFGSTVGSNGTSVVLGHPACAEAAERLRAWRSERARSSGKPAYTVFDDKTLNALAAALPTSETGLTAIPGIGPVKLGAYGAELIAIFDELRSATETARAQASLRSTPPPPATP
jgi:DNA helicase-2/ATP-dependent DNA helicase PcrA